VYFRFGHNQTYSTVQAVVWGMSDTRFQHTQHRRLQTDSAPLFFRVMRAAGLLVFSTLIALGAAWVLARAIPAGWLLPVILSPAPNVNQMVLLDLDRMTLGPLHEVSNPNRDPAIAPDRRSILYSALLSTETFGGGEIVLRDIASGSERRLTQDSFPDTSPAWSPDGRAAIFVSLRSFNTDIYLLDLVTGDARRLTDGPRPDFDPTWSPDGRYIAYVSYDDENDSDIFLLDATCNGICGQDARQLFDEPGYDLHPTWSLDGQQLAFVSDRDGDGFQVFLVRGDCLDDTRSCTEAIRRLTATFPFANYELAWTVDGQLLVLVPRARGIEIYRLDADCAQVQIGCPVAALGAIGRDVAAPAGP